jgi:phosphoenolpyruvate carboxylase
VKDYQNGNFDNTKSNIIERIIPKAIERITKVKKVSNLPPFIKLKISILFSAKKVDNMRLVITQSKSLQLYK